MKLNGLAINFLGDSITEGCGTSGPDKAFAHLLEEACQLSASRNYGIGGTRIARQQTPSADPKIDRDFCLRASEMDENADVVVVFGGTNDFGHGDAPFGPLHDRTPDTFCGACHVLFQTLLRRYPVAKIVVVTPLHRVNESDPRGDGSRTTPARPLADYVGALCDIGVDAIMWDTLFASGSIMSKDMWRDMEAEPMRMLAETVRQHGCMNMIHNCGQRIYFDAQIEAVDPVAISFLYPPDDCADYAECKAKYGDRVALIGAVTPANAVIGTDEEWDEQCRSQIDAMAAGGGFLLATGCEYPANATFDRAQRMIDIAKTYGAYRK